MKILLTAVNAKYIHSNPAVYSLRASAEKYLGAETSVEVVIAEYTINQRAEDILAAIYLEKPDVLCFSCYIWNVSCVTEVAREFHRLRPEVPVWVGGPEVSYDAGAFLAANEAVTGVMTGEGEQTFPELCSYYADGAPEPERIRGIVFRRNESIVTTEERPPSPLDDIPFCYDSLSGFENRILYYESGRGCPFSCSYCLSSLDKCVRFRSLSLVKRELLFFLEHRVSQVKFVDRTFNCNHTHAMEIWRFLAEHDNGVTNFHFEIAADLLTEEELELLGRLRPGQVQLEIGVQSTCPETIAAIERHTDFSKVAAAVTRIRSFQNIHIHLDLIAGLPYEDLATFKNSFHDVYALRPHQLQLGFLKVLKGSAMELRAPEYDLLYTSQPPYEVLATRWLSYDDICLLKQVEKVVEIYYNSGQFTHTLRFLQPFFDSPFAMYESLAGWYETHHLSDIQSSRVRKYEILLSFSCARLSDRLDEKLLCSLKESLTYDLYLREPMKNRPAFALSLTRWKDDIRNLLMEESVSHDLFAHYADCSYRELTKQLHIEVFTSIFPVPTAVLFDYHSRDPLTNNCAAIQKPLKLS